MGIVRSAERRRRLLLATKPDIVWNGAEKVIARISAKDGTKTILEVIPTTGLETDSINIKPCTPEEPSKPVHVTIDDPSSVVSEAQVHDGLNVEINDTDDSSRRKECWHGINDRVEIRLIELVMI